MKYGQNTSVRPSVCPPVRVLIVCPGVQLLRILKTQRIFTNFPLVCE